MNHPIKNSLFAAIVAIISCLVTMEAQAFPTGPALTIQNPCGRDLLASSTQTFLPLSQEVQLSIGSLRTLGRQVQSLMIEYKTQNVVTEAEVRNLASPLSNLEGLPSRQSSDYTELVPQLRQDHHDISVFLVYLQHAQIQQLAYDGNLLKTELHNVNHALFSVLCRVDTLLSQQGATPNHIVDSSVFPSGFRTMPTSQDRYYRDFVLMKDTKAYVEVMTEDYENLFFRLSEES